MTDLTPTAPPADDIVVTFTYVDYYENTQTESFRCNMLELAPGEGVITLFFYELRPSAGSYTKHLMAGRTNVIRFDVANAQPSEKATH